MRERTVKGIADALANTEETYGQMDGPGPTYARGLRIGMRVLDHLADRRRGHEVISDRIEEQKRIAEAIRLKDDGMETGGIE